VSTFRKVRYYAYIVITFVGVAVVGGLSFHHACRALPEAKQTFGVAWTDEYKEPTEAAMDLINGFVGCKLLIPGSDGIVKGADGEPCGKAFHENIPDEHHSARAFQCNDPSRPFRWEAHIYLPGDSRTQMCIAAHEIGHMLGMEDKPASYRGIMNQKVCPEKQIILSDEEVEYLSGRFCK